jgi:hypothetical protein
MFELLLQTFWAKKIVVKSRQGNLLHWNVFTGLNKTSLYYTKGGDQLKKIRPFFSTCAF